jgi:hypothetical protein
MKYDWRFYLIVVPTLLLASAAVAVHALIIF